MIVPIDLPPGAHWIGTEYQSKGRWRTVDRVRWRRNAMQPVKGWTGFTDDYTGFATDSSTNVRVLGAIAWTTNSGAYYVIGGSNLYVGVCASDGTTTDLTPVGLTTGNVSWQWGIFGEIPIGCGNEDGRLWEWDLNTANNLTQVSGSPTSCIGVCVTAERFIFALGDGGNPRSIRWCDREDRTQWTPATTNQAGGYDLDTEGEIRFALQMRGETLIVTSKDCWRARYVGYPDVYVFERVGPCSAVGNNVGVVGGDRAFWMGDTGFWQYAGGSVAPLSCDVLDYFVSDIATTFNPAARLEVTSWHNSEQNEVWWLYRSTSSSTYTDSYIAYNYLENTWHYGRQPCSTIVDKVPFETPIGFRASSTIVLNDDFSSNSGWSLPAGNWQISGGTLNMSTPASGHEVAHNSLAVTLGQTYAVRFTIAGRTAGGVTLYIDNVAGATYSTNATHTVLVTFGSAGVVAFRSSGLFDGTIDDLLIRQAVVLEFESGWVYEGTAPYAETGPIDIGDGERRVHVMQVIPDEQTAGELKYTFKHREYPNATETTETTVTATAPTDVRFSGRHFTMKVEPVVTSGVAADWRCGVTRLDVMLGGKR